MIRRKIISNKLPSIEINYCTGINEGYKDVVAKHGVNMDIEMIENDDHVYGFTITSEFDDAIEIYLDLKSDPEIYAKTAIHEAINAALTLVRRKLFYTMDDSYPIVLGDDPDTDEAIYEIISKVATKVLLMRFNDE